MAIGDTSDDYPLEPLNANPARPSIAEQKRVYTEQNPPPTTSDDSYPLEPSKPPSILDSSWQVAGKQLWDAGVRGVGLGTRDVIQGATSLGTGALDLATWPMRAIQRAIGVPTDAPSTMRDKALDAVGLPTPQTPSEQNISLFNQGATAALTGGAAGSAAGLTSAAPTVANAARLALTGGTGAVAGKTASESELVPPTLKPTVDLLMNLLAAKGVDTSINLGAKVGNAVAGNVSPVYDAFMRSRVDPRLLGTVAGGTAGQSVEAAASRVPFASSVMRPVQENTVRQFGDAVERSAAQLDPNNVSATAQTTGDFLQKDYRNWVDNVFNGPQGRQAQAWQPLNQRMAGTSVDQSAYRAALDDAANPPNLTSLPANQQAFASTQARKWLDALDADIPPGGKLSWEQAQAIKQRIGDAMGTPDIVGSIGIQNLKRIYAGLASGMEDAAVAHGQGDLFKAANEVTTQGHAFIDNVGSKIAKANNPTQESVNPEQATNNLLNGGDTTLQAVRQELPDSADALAAFKLRQASTAKPSVAGNYNDTSTGTYLTNMNSMRQSRPGGYAALYNDPAVQAQLDDLTTVAQRLRATERHLNTSGTAEQLGWMQYLQGIGNAAAELKPFKALGAVTIPPTIGVGLGKLMTSPTATRLAAAQGAKPPLIPSRAAGLLGAQATIPEFTIRPGDQ